MISFDVGWSVFMKELRKKEGVMEFFL